MKCNPAGIQIIKEFESLRLTAYYDPIGKLTIGWGSTRGVVAGMKIDKKKANELLEFDLEEAETILNNLELDLTSNEFSALVSFVFNVGPGKTGVKDGFVRLRNGQPSTMLRMLRLGDKPAAADQFPNWCRAGGKILMGLVRRRAEEKALFLKAD